MALFGVELDAGVAAEFDELGVHACADKAFAGEALDDVAELALLGGDDGGQEHDAGLGGESEDLVNDVAGGLVGDGLAADGAVGLADMGEKEAEIVVNLGGGGDDGARVCAGDALFDGDGRGKALDEVHVGLLHLIEELAGVCGEGFDVFALALGIDGVEGKGGFAGAAQAGDDDQFAAGDGERQVLQIVLARATDSNGFDCHEW